MNNNKKLAKDLLIVAKSLLSAETFPCPECGTKVLENTKYCMKCKKKVEKTAKKLVAKEKITKKELLSFLKKKGFMKSRLNKNQWSILKNKTNLTIDIKEMIMLELNINDYDINNLPKPVKLNDLNQIEKKL